MIASATPDFFKSPNWSFHRKLQNIAKHYEQEGYDVEFSPPQYKLPSFLVGFYPDFVATRDSEHIVVDVKSAAKVRPTAYWHDLAATFKTNQDKGWQYRPDIDNQPTESLAGISVEDADDQLSHAERYQNAGQLVHSLLLTWPAVEAAMRWAVDVNRVEVPDYTAPRLISSLYADGVLEREEYNLLLKYLPISSAALEYRSYINANDLDELRALARRLMRARNTDYSF